ncbi:outer membrane beta-barrel protein, partial [Blastomonas sp. CCH7-E1]|uniref:outer membrane protein n=1 Tax=Blastomonas sp. CCH7-E1 TaxID=1768745 RepID=UPI0012E35DAE
MRKLVVGLALASTALTTPAFARDGQWYVGVEGGAMIVEDIEFDVGALNNATIVDSDTGYDVGAVVGYDFGPFRLEAEVSYREADLTDVQTQVGISRGAAPTAIGRFASVGSANALAFMVNGLIDFGPDDGLQGFVGGGVGVARTDFNGSTQPGTGPYIDDSDTGFAWQVLAGIRAPISDSWDVGLKYRFFNSDSVDLLSVNGREFDGRFRSHSILGSIIYNFGGEEAAPPPPPCLLYTSP